MNTDNRNVTEQLVGVGKNAIDQLAQMILDLNNQLVSRDALHGAEREKLERELNVLRERHAVLGGEVAAACKHAEDMKQEIEAVRERLEIAEKLSAFDPLTEIQNESQLRLAVHEAIKQYGRVGHDAQFCVAMIDLDGFKLINDQDKSHQDGDGALKHFAQVGLNSVRRPQDLVVRKGGDEFAALLLNCTPEGARAFNDRLREAMSIKKYVTESGRVYEIRYSFGAAFYEEGDTYEDLLKRADRACYEDKEERKGRRASEEEHVGEVFLEVKGLKDD